MLTIFSLFGDMFLILLLLILDPISYFLWIKIVQRIAKEAFCPTPGQDTPVGGTIHWGVWVIGQSDGAKSPVKCRDLLRALAPVLRADEDE